MEKISVLVVDDHAIVRNGINGFLRLQEDIHVVGEAASGQEAVRLVKDFVPDIVLMDLVMPDMDGVEATARIREISPRTQVVVLTSHHGDENVFPAIQAGALSYVLKDIAPEDLLDVVRVAAKGEASLNPAIATRIVKAMRGEDNDLNPYIELTERERDVLLLIADGKTNTEIAAKLVLSIGTVKGYVSNILSKLHLSDRTQAAVYAWREGLKRRTDC
ncbi:MAG: response regulator transcription factor [Chloroflexi bacterium]|nr:response regulator transcription factor [Chloroflexota bacterium]